MVGLLKPTHQEAQIRSAGNQQARLLASIRPHGVVLVFFVAGTVWSYKDHHP